MAIALSNTFMGSNWFEKCSIWQAESLGPELQIYILSLPPPVCFSSLQHPLTISSHISDGYRGELEGCKMDLQYFRFKTFAIQLHWKNCRDFKSWNHPKICIFFSNTRHTKSWLCYFSKIFTPVHSVNPKLKSQAGPDQQREVVMPRSLSSLPMLISTYPMIQHLERNIPE